MHEVWAWLQANGLEVLGWWVVASLATGTLWGLAMRNVRDRRPPQGGGDAR